MNDNLSIRVRAKYVPPQLQVSFQIGIVFNDPVMNNRNFPRTVCMGVCIGVIRDPVGCPTGMADTNLPSEIGCCTGFFRYAALVFGEIDTCPQRRHPERVIATVLEFFKSLDYQRCGLSPANIPDNATHVISPWIRPVCYGK